MIRDPRSRRPAVVGFVLGGLVCGVLAVGAVRETGERASIEPRGRELTVAELYASNARGVVEVLATPGTGHESSAAVPDRYVPEPSGSGFVYDALGRIVTSHHVVGGASAIHVRLADGSLLPARLLVGDGSSDVAVLDVEAEAGALHPLTLGDSSRVEVGEGVVAIGSPFGMAGSVTSGIVSAVGRTISSPDSSRITGAIQTDAAINHGNSGGPLLDMRGNVIGLVAQFQSVSDGSSGVGLAVPSNTVGAVVARLFAEQSAALAPDAKHASMSRARKLLRTPASSRKGFDQPRLSVETTRTAAGRVRREGEVGGRRRRTEA